MTRRYLVSREIILTLFLHMVVHHIRNLANWIVKERQNRILQGYYLFCEQHSIAFKKGRNV